MSSSRSDKKSKRNEIVLVTRPESIQDRYPHYKLEADPVRGTAVFRHNETTTYSPEELLGMLIGHAQFIAERCVFLADFRIQFGNCKACLL